MRQLQLMMEFFFFFFDILEPHCGWYRDPRLKKGEEEGWPVRKGTHMWWSKVVAVSMHSNGWSIVAASLQT